MQWPPLPSSHDVELDAVLREGQRALVHVEQDADLVVRVEVRAVEALAARVGRLVMGGEGEEDDEVQAALLHPHASPGTIGR